MKKIITAAVVLLTAAAFILAAGCTSSTGNSSAGEPQILKFGYQPSTHQIPYMTAMQKGWWNESVSKYGYTTGSDCEYQFGSGAPEMQAMLAGEIQVAYVGSAPVLSAIATGLDAKIVAAGQIQGSSIVVSNDFEYTGPESLKGKKIGTFQKGTIQDTLIRTWFKNAGMDPENDVEIVGMGPGDAVTSFSAGHLDAVFLPEPSPAVLVNDNFGKIAVTSGEMEKNHACCVLLVSGKLIRENPELVKEIVKTHIRATEFTTANPKDAAKIYSDYCGTAEDIIEASLENWDGGFVSDPKIITESVVNYAKEQAELGYLVRELSESEIFDCSFYDAAVKEL